MSPASLVLAACALLAGCGSLSSDDGGTHWFTPERVAPTRLTSGRAALPALHLGGVSRLVDPGQRIVYGDGAYQIGFYKDRMWTEPPALYVRRALFRALFEEPRFRPGSERDAPTLEVDVPVFQELKIPGTHAARVVLHVVLGAEHVLYTDTIVVTELVTGKRFADVVAAMGRALDGAANETARRIELLFAAPEQTL